MWQRCVAFMVLYVSLSGCVLQSKAPNFQEQQGVALPKELGTQFVTENFTDGAWKTDEGRIRFAASGKHYVVKNEKLSEIDVLFVRLGNAQWVMQAAERQKPSAYILVEAKDNTLLLRPLLCDALKLRDDVKKYVTFSDNDCFLKDNTELSVFKMLAAKAMPAKLRLRAVK
jgi:hypothetical protein